MAFKVIKASDIEPAEDLAEYYKVYEGPFWEIPEDMPQVFKDFLRKRRMGTSPAHNEQVVRFVDENEFWAAVEADKNHYWTWGYSPEYKSCHFSAAASHVTWSRAKK